MDLTKLYEAHAEKQTRQRNLMEVAKREKRDMTDDEKTEFDQLAEEKRYISRQIELLVEPPAMTDKSAKREAEKRFAKFASDAVDGKKRSLEIELRGNGNPITAEGTHDSLVPNIFKGILDPLRKELILEQLGVKMVDQTVGEPYFVKHTSIEASIEGENTSVASSKVDFSTIKATPKRIAVSVPVSKRAIYSSNIDLLSLVTSEMGRAVAEQLNSAMLANKEIGKSSTKIKGAFADIVTDNKLTYKKGGAPTFADIVALETAVLSQEVNVARGAGAYALGTKLAGVLKSTPIEKGSPIMILQGNAKEGYTMNGYPAIVTNFVPEKTVYFGDFSYESVVHFGKADFVIDPYTRKGENIVEFCLNLDADLLTAYKEAFATLTEALA